MEQSFHPLAPPLKGGYFGIIVLVLADRLGEVLVPAQEADITKLDREDCTFMLVILVRWRSVTLSCYFLWSTRFTIGISLFIIITA